MVRREQGGGGSILSEPARRWVLPTAPWLVALRPTASSETTVAATAGSPKAGPIHPLFAFLLAAAVPLFLGGLLSDITYGTTAEPQWANFAAWLVAGAMVFTGAALLWAFLALFIARARWTGARICFVLLFATFALGLLDSFQHAKDAWAIMPAATVLSALVTLVAALACAAGLATLRVGRLQ